MTNFLFNIWITVRPNFAEQKRPLFGKPDLFGELVMFDESVLEKKNNRHLMPVDVYPIDSSSESSSIMKTIAGPLQGVLTNNHRKALDEIVNATPSVLKVFGDFFKRRKESNK